MLLSTEPFDSASRHQQHHLHSSHSRLPRRSLASPFLSLAVSTLPPNPAVVHFQQLSHLDPSFALARIHFKGPHLQPHFHLSARLEEHFALSIVPRHHSTIRFDSSAEAVIEQCLTTSRLD